VKAGTPERYVTPIHELKTKPQEATIGSLTQDSTIGYLLRLENGEGKMKGTIRPTSRHRSCPACGKRFESIHNLGYICQTCKTTPQRFYIDLWWKGRNCCICSDKTGQPLDSYERARRLQAHIQTEIDNHTFDPSRYVKGEIQKFYFEQLIGKWLREKERLAEKGELSYAYINPLRGYVNNYFLPFFKGKDTRDIRTIDIKEFHRQLPNKLSQKTQRNILNALENVFRVLVEDEVIDKKPIFPQVSVPDPLVTWCGRETQDKILGAIPEQHRFVFYFLTRQGVRPGEAVAIKWGDIDLKLGTLTVKRAMSNRKIVERTKTGKITTRLLHPDILDTLRNIPTGLPHSYIFINPNSRKPYLTDTLQKIWRKACKKVNIDIKLYEATRHSVASMAASSGVSMAIIKEVLGHTDIRTTQKYSHLDVLAQSQVFAAQNPEQTLNKSNTTRNKLLHIRDL
jgi:integrase